MTVLRMRGRAGASRLFWLPAVLLLAAVALPAAAAEPIVVSIDEARIMKIPDRAATVVVGNPLIADLSIQPGGIAVVTGKGFGATNFVVMDRDGAVLLDKIVEVKWPNDKMVVVYRGVNRETYSCTPDCSRRVTLGDFSDYFEKTLAETVARNNQATAAAATSAH